MSRSLIEEIALLPEEQQREFFKGYTEEDFKMMPYDWDLNGRPEQKPPEDNSWHIFLALAGRGWGKSRAGAEWIRKKVADAHPQKLEILLLGRTASDVRDVMVRAILEAYPEGQKPEYKPSLRRLEWPNGSYALCTSSESPDQLRGPQGHIAWVDEMAALKNVKDDSGATAWTNLIAATRLGDYPQIFCTTTPKRTALMKQMVEDSKDPKKKIKIVKGSTFDNTNLSEFYIDSYVQQYSGNKQLAQQELYGEMLDDAAGLFFNDKMIEDATVTLESVPKLPLKFISVDPSVAEKPRDECGIVAVGVTGEKNITDRKVYILEDHSLKAAPPEWAARVVEAAKIHRTKYIVVEGNQGKQLLQMAINAIDPTLKVFLVNASQGKHKRAEPVVIAMSQKRVKIVDTMPELTDQCIFFDPEDTSSSPDRMDAMVHGVVAALISPPDGLRMPRNKIVSATHKRLPSGRGTGRSRYNSSMHRNRFGR